MWWKNTGLTKEEYIELQETYIEKFLDKGYTVWFKPHPRDGRDYIKNDKVKVLETALPLECYKFSNVVATENQAKSRYTEEYKIKGTFNTLDNFISRLDKAKQDKKKLFNLMNKINL